MQSSGPRFVSLCDRVVLVEWSLPGPADGPSTLTGTFGEAVVPLSALKLAEERGGTRILWALERPADETAIYLAAAGGEGSTPVEYAAQNTAPITAAIFDGLTPPARLSPA